MISTYFYTLRRLYGLRFYGPRTQNIARRLFWRILILQFSNKICSLVKFSWLRTWRSWSFLAMIALCCIVHYIKFVYKVNKIIFYWDQSLRVKAMSKSAYSADERRWPYSAIPFNKGKINAQVAFEDSAKLRWNGKWAVTAVFLISIGIICVGWKSNDSTSYNAQSIFKNFRSPEENVKQVSIISSVSNWD